MIELEGLHATVAGAVRLAAAHPHIRRRRRDAMASGYETPSPGDENAQAAIQELNSRQAADLEAGARHFTALQAALLSARAQIDRALADLQTQTRCTALSEGGSDERRP